MGGVEIWWGPEGSELETKDVRLAKNNVNLCWYVACRVGIWTHEG